MGMEKKYYYFTQLIRKNIYTRAKSSTPIGKNQVGKQRQRRDPYLDMHHRCHEPSPEHKSPIPLGVLVRSKRPG